MGDLRSNLKGLSNILNNLSIYNDEYDTGQVTIDLTENFGDLKNIVPTIESAIIKMEKEGMGSQSVFSTRLIEKKVPVVFEDEGNNLMYINDHTLYRDSFERTSWYNTIRYILYMIPSEYRDHVYVYLFDNNNNMIWCSYHIIKSAYYPRLDDIEYIRISTSYRELSAKTRDYKVTPMQSITLIPQQYNHKRLY